MTIYLTREIPQGSREFKSAIDRANESGRQDIAYLLRTGSRLHERTRAKADDAPRADWTDEQINAWLASRKKSQPTPLPQPAPAPPPLAAHSLDMPITHREPEGLGDPSLAIVEEANRMATKSMEELEGALVDDALISCFRGLPDRASIASRDPSQELADMALKLADETLALYKAGAL